MEAITQNWTVVNVREGKTEPNPHKPSQMLQKFWVDLRGENGTDAPGVYWRRVEGNKPHGEVYGTVREGDYGPIFKQERQDGAPSRPNTTAGRGPGPAPKDDAFWAQKDQRIARAGVLQAVVSGPLGNRKDEETLAAWVERINRLTDALLKSLDEATPHPSGGVSASSDSPAPAASPPPEVSEAEAAQLLAEEPQAPITDDSEVPF